MIFWAFVVNLLMAYLWEDLAVPCGCLRKQHDFHAIYADHWNIWLFFLLVYLDTSSTLLIAAIVFILVLYDWHTPNKQFLDSVCTDMDEVYHILSNMMKDTSSESYFLSILQHFLLIRNDYYVRWAWFLQILLFLICNRTPNFNLKGILFFLLFISI